MSEVFDGCVSASRRDARPRYQESAVHRSFYRGAPRGTFTKREIAANVPVCDSSSQEQIEGLGLSSRGRSRRAAISWRLG